MDTALATANNLPAAPTGAWGSENTLSKDLLIPRIYLMQDLSDQVKKGRVKVGDLINSMSGEVLANADTPVEIIPILTFSEWLTHEVENPGTAKQKLIFQGKVLLDKTNENWTQEAMVNGKLLQRTRQLNFLCLLPKYQEELPFLVSFRKTSMMTGKKLSTHFQMSAMKGNPPAKQVFNLTSQAMTRNGYNFYGYYLEPGRASGDTEMKLAYKWYKLFNEGAAKAADDLLPEEAPF
jgi:hypothetical protein